MRHVRLLLSLLLFSRASSLTAQGPAFNYPELQREAVSLLSRYLQINTSNPPGNELAAARWLQETLSREGIESRILDTTELGPGRANLYARLKGSGKARAVALVHHMDVVPALRESWTVDPFAGLVQGGKVWGRGAIDMKGHGIMQLMALIALKRAGVRLDRDVVFIANADEEVDATGAVTFTERHADLLADVEYLLTEGEDTRVEGGKVRWFGVNTAEKRWLWLRLTAHGVTSHGSLPIGDQNPVPRLAAAITRVARWQTPVRLIPAVEESFKALAPYETGEGRRWLADPAAALRSPAGRRWLLSDPERNAKLRATISPTVLTGSTQTNIIPAEASVALDIRLLPDEDIARFKQALQARIADSTITMEEITPTGPPVSAPLGTALYRDIEAVIGTMLPGVPVAPAVAVGATDRPWYSRLGIICYGVEPFLIPIDEYRMAMHGNDERISLANVGFGVEFYLRLLTRHLAE